MTDPIDHDYSSPAPKKKSKTLPIIIIAVIGLIAFTGYTLYQRIQMWSTMGPPDFGPAGVIVVEAKPIMFSDRIEAIGTAEADESTTISASETEIIEGILFEDGQFVKKDDLLIQLKDDEEVATYEEARKSFNRYAALAKSNAGSVARRDEAKALMQVAWARVDDRKIKAPFDGIVGIREVSVGDLISPGTVITTIDDIDPIEVEFTVPERFLSSLRPGLDVRATSDAYKGQVFNGTVTTVNSRLDPITRSVRVKARIDNPDSLLRPGLLMSVEIVQNTRSSLAVPEESLLSSGKQKSVTIITEDGENKIATPVPVTIGTRRAGYVEILSGINEGDLVVAEGVLKARPGAPVVVKETRTIDDQIEGAIKYATPSKQNDLENLDLTTEQMEPNDMPMVDAPPPVPVENKDEVADEAEGAE
ncbi:MAG: efflux RND transporter periplasmic adaptor subunit [Pseudomonadota bacterium]